MKSLLPVALLSLSGIAYAEHGCQDGFIPVNQGNGQTCVADYNLPYWKSQNNSVPVPAAPRWKTTWGAVAMSTSGTGDVGTSVGKYSKNDAKDEAIQRCEAGGSKCKLSLAYHNQCVAIAWASENGIEVGGAVHTQSGPNIVDVSQYALTACSKARNGGECTIVYSECTKPVQL